MRIGGNPQKSEATLELTNNHRVVVVVFIPEMQGYYKDMFEVVKLSIQSIINTLPPSSVITIVDNASCTEVREYFIALLNNKQIDTLQLFNENVGKIDALMGAARTAREPLLTLTDCDILFTSGWVEETMQIFNTFKNVGSVAPYPTRRGLTYYTYSLQKDVLLKKIKLFFEPIKENFDPYNRFLKSINWEEETNAEALWPIIKKGKVKACVGSDHQVVTLRRDILFTTTPSTPSFTKVGKESERTYVDLAIDLFGKYRLATYRYYGHHMGNTVEPWMLEMSKENKKEKVATSLVLNPPLQYDHTSHTTYKIWKKIIKKMFYRKVPKKYIVD